MLNTNQATRDVMNEYHAPKIVSSREELQEWYERVQSDPEIQERGITFRYLLMAMGSPKVLDRNEWRSMWFRSKLSEEIGVSEETISEYSEAIQDCKYIYQVGTADVETGRGTEQRPRLALALPPKDTD